MIQETKEVQVILSKRKGISYIMLNNHQTVHWMLADRTAAYGITWRPHKQLVSELATTTSSRSTSGGIFWPPWQWETLGLQTVAKHIAVQHTRYAHIHPAPDKCWLLWQSTQFQLNDKSLSHYNNYKPTDCQRLLIVQLGAKWTQYIPNGYSMPCLAISLLFSSTSEVVNTTNDGMK